VELIHRFDIHGREEELDIPQLILIADKDWFTDPENSRKLASFHPKSEVVSFGDAHRIIVDNEDNIVKNIERFIKAI